MTPPSSGHGQRREASPDVPPTDAGGEKNEPLGYDTDKEDYAGISSGTLDTLEGLHDARDFAEMIVDTIREGLLVLDFGLRVVAANESFYDQFGVGPEGTVGRLVYDLGNGQWDLPELRELLEGILPHEKVLNDYEVDHTFDGIGRRVMLLNARRLDDHQLVLLAIEDVTELRAREEERRLEHAKREHAEGALRQSAAAFRHLADAVPHLVWTARPDGAVSCYNSEAERYDGFRRTDDGSWAWASVLHPDDLRSTTEAWQQAVETGTPYEVEHRLRMADGSYRWHVSRALPTRDARGEVERWYGTATDVHALKETEAALRTLNETLEKRVRDRTRQVRSLSRSLALAEQHERQRLAYVLHDDLQQLLAGAKMAVPLADEHLNQILDRAIDLTRSLSHELAPPLLAEENLPELLRWLAERKRQLYGLDIEVQVDPRARLPEADLRILVYHILRELLFNVAKHAGTNRARVAVEQRGSYLCVVVEDAGAGFDPAALTEAATSGLGLASVRERLELVGGLLDVDSAPGAGTRVTIEVPSLPE